MDLKEMKTFVTVAKFGSFSKASESLGYTQAAVTIQIKNLETELDTKLFDRIGKRINLTSHGKVFHEYAVHILNDVIEAREAISASSEIIGSIKIGAIDSICSGILPELLKNYHIKHDGVMIKILNDTPTKLFEKINQNELDLLYLLDESITNSNYKKILNIEEEIVFVCSAEHILAQRDTVRIDELLRHPFILTEPDASYRKILDRELSSKEKEIIPFIESQNTELVCQMVISNFGVSFLPKFLINEYIDIGKMKVLQIPEIKVKLYRQVLCHKDKWVTKEMKALFELLE